MLFFKSLKVFQPSQDTVTPEEHLHCHSSDQSCE